MLFLELHEKVIPKWYLISNLKPDFCFAQVFAFLPNICVMQPIIIYTNSKYLCKINKISRNNLYIASYFVSNNVINESPIKNIDKILSKVFHGD